MTPFVRRLIYMSLFLTGSVCVILLGIIPFFVGVPRIPAPEVILCFSLVWVLRRPDYIPLGLAAGVFLAQDFLMGRPLGLSACLSVLALEFLRSRELIWREQPFLTEWLLVGIVVFAVFLSHAFVLALFSIPWASFGMIVLQSTLTVLIYPVAVVVSEAIFGITRRPLDGSEDMG